jgi:hypothetical protein
MITQSVNLLELANEFADLAITCQARWYAAFEIANTATTQQVRIAAFKTCDRLNTMQARLNNSSDMCFAEAIVT